VVTLGRLGFDGPGGANAARLLKQPKRVALLLYVLMSQRGGWLSRDQLIGTFWPESNSTRARNALRQALSFLRSCLGDDVVLSVGSHGVAVAGSVTCDAVRFEELLDASRTEEALNLYGGEFLPGFHSGGSFAFAEWLDGRRQHLSRRAAKAAWDLSAECEARGELPGAAFWGKRALALSPFSESEVQRLLRLLVRVGDFAGALRAFHGLQNALESEFGSRPSTETALLAAEIRRRLESEGLHVPALLGTRRSGTERRAAQRRTGKARWTGDERRQGAERRSTERRSGLDRREIR
jgi:DNA-binding SARP family transcriptional activator